VNYSNFKSHFLNWREWEFNPVVVKELRQSVRSWAVTGMLLLFLAVLFCTSLAFLIGQSFQLGVNQRLGGEIFQVFTVILTGASLLFIPLYVGVRLAAERQESNLDLLYISTLTPERIIRGKFLCGAYMTVLFFSACMPFMAFTNLLRGVDLPTVVFILLCLFLVVCSAVQVAIFLACLPISRVFKILVALAGTIALVPLTTGLTFAFFEMMRSGIGSMLMGGTNFWAVFFTTAGMVLAAVVLLYFLSVAMISPPSANRAPPIRIYVTVTWLIGLVISWIWARQQHDARVILPWMIISLVVLAAALVIVVSNHDVLSLRVRRKIPVQLGRRAVAFLFFNGAAGGLIWIALLAAATLAIAAGALRYLPDWIPGMSSLTGGDLFSFEICTAVTVLYGFSYALTALFVHRQFFSRRPPKLAGVFAILLPGAWALIPSIVLFFLNRLSFQSLEGSQLGNIFNVFMVKEPNARNAHLLCALLWLVLMVILNLRWFMRQVAVFSRLEPNSAVSESSPGPVPPRIPRPAELVEP
jgi:hypothetical protein